jgi:hypothetical protein
MQKNNLYYQAQFTEAETMFNILPYTLSHAG